MFSVCLFVCLFVCFLRAVISAFGLSVLLNTFIFTFISCHYCCLCSQINDWLIDWLMINHTTSQVYKTCDRLVIDLLWISTCDLVVHSAAEARLTTVRSGAACQESQAVEGLENRKGCSAVHPADCGFADGRPPILRLLPNSKLEVQSHNHFQPDPLAEI